MAKIIMLIQGKVSSNPYLEYVSQFVSQCQRMDGIKATNAKNVHIQAVTCNSRPQNYKGWQRTFEQCYKWHMTSTCAGLFINNFARTSSSPRLARTVRPNAKKIASVDKEFQRHPQISTPFREQCQHTSVTYEWF